MSLNHPELLEGEMFLMNISGYTDSNKLPSKSNAMKNLANCGYTSKRVGDTAYDIHGNVLDGWFPVFIQKSEYEQWMAKYTTRQHGTFNS